jgi:hypothetical protein
VPSLSKLNNQKTKINCNTSPYNAHTAIDANWSRGKRCHTATPQRHLAHKDRRPFNTSKCEILLQKLQCVLNKDGYDYDENDNANSFLIYLCTESTA